MTWRCLMQSGQTKASPLWKTHESPPGVCKANHLKDSWTVRNKILWSDKAEIEFCSLNLKRLVWRKAFSTHHLPNTMVAASCCVRVFQWLGCGTIVRVDGQPNGSTYRDHLNENRSSGWDKGSPSNTIMTLSTQPTTQEWLRDNSIVLKSWCRACGMLQLSTEQRVWIFS